MPKRAWTSLLLAAGLLVAGSTLLLSATYSLAGQVSDAETGLPLAGTVVTFAGRSTTTDASGAFDLRDLRGVPLLRIEAPGYDTAGSLALVGQALSGGAPKRFCLQPAELHGRVLDAETHTPIAGATIAAGAAQATSDAEGRYSIKRLPRGSDLVVRAPHFADAAPLRYTGQAAQNVSLRLLPATVAVRDACNGEPLPGVAVSAAGAITRSDAAGNACFPRLGPDTRVEATQSGYSPATGQVSPGDTLTLALRRGTLSGTVRSAGGQPLANALVLARAPGQHSLLAHTDEAGNYQFECVPPGATLTVRLAGYRKEERTTDGTSPADFALEPFVAKGIYLGDSSLALVCQPQVVVDLALVDRTELNAVVIDIKTQEGRLGFAPALPLAREIGAALTDVVDARALLADCRRRGIYTIARIPVFEDDILARGRPDWAVHRGSGAVWRAAGGYAWVDPFRAEVRDYDIAIAREAAGLGFDEIQFDYVRFPSDGNVLDCRYLHESTPESRVAAIADFLAAARSELDQEGVFLSADLFGLTSFSYDETGIGQLLEGVAPYVDYVSPMTYPSTYVPGMLGIGDPWRSPYEVVKLSVSAARGRTTALIRPWLQHFDDYNGTGLSYGPQQVRQQIQAATEAQACGWLFWNPGGVYDPASFAAR
ncbi:MAG TPA: putative glycoside hydrolase [Anaerolineae bacterium]|nr:putative glycoside hydrolase [Anaerolineae bacterium]HOR00801.1 putative glycoside hydrolase [Anaerolineae bacterium]HPL28536.1 putative glycoside hydrolase [Anaerolineae bacterium]